LAIALPALTISALKDNQTSIKTAIILLLVPLALLIDEL
jgi:hypothetical protein